MTDVALIDHSTRFERAWGCIVEGQHYRADVLVLPLANELPPDWFVFTLIEPPEGIALTDWFMVGATPYVAQRACELISVKLTQITEAEFVDLDARHAPPPPAPILAPADATLTPADFAPPPRPNRAQRRADGRPRRRR